MVSRILLALGLLGLAAPAEATLIDRGGGLIYDDDLNVTWLQDANYAATDLSDARVSQIIANVGSVASHALTASDFIKDIDGNYTGAMTWWGAMAWVEELTFGGFNDWRLPITNQPDPSCSFQTSGQGFGFGCTGSEMGHLFNVEDVSFAAPDPFLNLQSSRYWSGTEFINPSLTFTFFFGGSNAGGQSVDGKGNNGFAWAVRAGDVATVPEPGTFALMGLGLAGILGFGRRRR